MIRSIRNTAAGFAIVGLLALGACASMNPFADKDKVTLSGANEVPAVNTSASGTGTITIAQDGAVSGSITVTGIAATAGHIHQGAVGINGPVIVPFTYDSSRITLPSGENSRERPWWLPRSFCWYSFDSLPSSKYLETPCHTPFFNSVSR